MQARIKINYEFRINISFTLRLVGVPNPEKEE